MNELNHIIPVIFPNTLSHDSTAEAILKTLPDGYKVNSAGFINMNSCECYGESTTLGIKSMEGDTVKILMNDYSPFEDKI